MRTLLALLFLAFPLIEIAVLIQAGRILGVGPVLLLLLTSVALGIVLIRHQGVATLRRVRNAFAAGELPAMALLESLVVLVCGLLLVIPGFVSDFLALLGLVPPVRRFLLRRILPSRPPGPGGQSTIIEGEFRREEDRRLR